MPRKCTICSSHQRTEIESDIRQGVSFRNIKERYEKLSLGGISRHTNNCMVLDLQAALELQKRETAIDWYEELVEFRGEVKIEQSQARELFPSSETFRDKLKALKVSNSLASTASTLIDKGLRITGAYTKDSKNPWQVNHLAVTVLHAAQELEEKYPDENPDDIKRQVAEAVARKQLEDPNFNSR